MKTIQERLYANVIKQDGCWLSTYFIHTNGFAKIVFNGKQQYAHRLSFELSNGPIPDDRLVYHSCNNKHCVNPEHLYLSKYINQHENKTHCKRGHALEGKNLIQEKKQRKCRECAYEDRRRYEQKVKAKTLSLLLNPEF